MVESANKRALRLLDLMPYLTSHPGITTTEVANEFGVTKEQIIKDLALLHMCGLPGYTPLELIDISYDDDIVHVRDPQNLDRPRNLTLAEVLILRIALQALLDYLPEGKATRKEIEVLDSKLRSSFTNTLPANVVLSKDGSSKAVMATLAAAIDNGTKARIRYLNKVRDQKTDRVISPYAVIVDDDKTIVKAWCDLANGERSFILNQIESAELLHEASYSTSGDSSEPLKVVMKIDPQSTFLETHRKKLEKQGSNYQLEIFQREWLIREVLSAHGEVEILAPGEIRELIRQRAEAVRALYK